MGRQRGRLVPLELRKKIVELIKEAHQNGARLIPACKTAGISKRTYERWTKDSQVQEDQRKHAVRPTPKNKLTDEEREAILSIVNLKEYRNLTPNEIVPKLADEGIYVASESTFYRVLREEKQLKHRGRSKQPSKKTPPTHVADQPNQVWSWDITWLHRKDVRGLYYKLYMILDIFSRKIVRYEVWEEENSKHSEELVKRTLIIEKVHGKPLVLHSDNGGPMKAATFLGTLEKLGVQSSFSRPRVSNDNPYSESLFRTLKYFPKYPTSGFESLSHARRWVSEFVYWYNECHYHSGIKYVTPGSRHRGEDKLILENRKEVYRLAKTRTPERWTTNIRDWSYIGNVALNPIKKQEVPNKTIVQNRKQQYV